MVDRGGIVEDTHVGVVHLVVTQHNESRRVNTLVRVGLGLLRSLLHGAESVADSIHEGVVVDGASAHNDNVLACVVGGLELGEHVHVDVLQVVSITADRLSHHVVSEGVEVASFKSRGLLVLVHGIVLGSLLLLGNFELSLVESGVVDYVSEHGESTADVTLHAGNVQVAHLAVGFGSNSGTHAFNFFG